ncbi:MAG: STAS domain-containing protein [Acidimicrobiia bacterium]
MGLGPQFSLETDRIGGNDVVAVRGEVDLATAPRLDTALKKFSGQEVFLDLRGVDFMDSAGLKVLISHRHRIETSGGALRVVLGEGPVMRLLELSGVRDTFAIRPKIDALDT